METISWEDRDGARWIELEGELDNAGCLVVKDEFERAVRDGVGDVVVVLSGVTFLSSMTVGLLLEARQRLQEQGRAFQLSGMSPQVRRILDLMSLSEMFDEID